TQGGGVDAEARLHGGQGLRLLQAPQAGHHRVKKVEQQQAGILIVEQLPVPGAVPRSEEHTSELQSRFDLVCRLLLEKKKQEEADFVQAAIEETLSANNELHYTDKDYRIEDLRMLLSLGWTLDATMDGTARDGFYASD